VLYHLRERAIEHGVIPWCEENGVPEHAEENAGAGALDLSDADLARIDAAFPLGARPRSLPML
jgi:aryl-alcohol dehydrogenase-like predicted oxidoreductase